MPSQTTILLAEDETNDVFLMQRAFRKAKITCLMSVVRDGNEAIAYLAGDSGYADRQKFPWPDLLLLDLKLPRRTGFEVLAWIRSQPAPLNRLPVVILTSSQQSVDIERAYDLGANSYLVKPVTFEHLLTLVKGVQNYWLTLNQRPDVAGSPRNTG